MGKEQSRRRRWLLSFLLTFVVGETLSILIFLHQKVSGTNDENLDTPVIDQSISSSTKEGDISAVHVQLGPIFYNFFVPINRTDHVRSILEEQMMQRNLTAYGSTVLYTLISENKLDIVQQSELCGEDCRLRQHLFEGDEVDTYQALWEYCETHPNELVTYIHNRGSFHDTKSNTKSRRFGTKAALACRQNMLENPSKCNVCGPKFSLFPQYLTAANMWTARCDYISGLIAPTNYSTRMQEMYNRTLFHPELGNTTYACLKPPNQAENSLGLGRYAPERWIWSHPYVKPCDTLQVPVHLAPSDLKQDWLPVMNRAPMGTLRSNDKTYRKSWYRLTGRLFEWDYLYHLGPPKDSWIWTYYGQRDLVDGGNFWLGRCSNESGIPTNQSVSAELLKLYHPNSNVRAKL